MPILCQDHLGFERKQHFWSKAMTGVHDPPHIYATDLEVNLKSKPVLSRGPAGEEANSKKSLFEVPIIDL